MPQPSQQFAIRYDKSEITFITQFLVSPSDEEVLLDLSSGLLNDDSNPKTLPIQNRIALPWSTAERLATVLNQVVAAKKQSQNQRSDQAQNAVAPVSVPQATMPQLTR